MEQSLRANWRQFTLLLVVNAFVGGMVGIERSIMPQMGQQLFGLPAQGALFSFVAAFGLSKALANYYSGRWANRLGRRPLLLLGWLLGLPVPLLLLYAPNWDWVVAANVLLGLNQGLAWSSAVVMKIELAGERQRGLAVGLNEFSGYLAVAFFSFLSAWLAGRYGLRPYPFYVGLALAVGGLLLTLLWVRETPRPQAPQGQQSLQRLFWQGSWKHRVLGSVTQAGFVNNLNDGMAWGLFPLLLAAQGMDLAEIGLLTALYPAVWGTGQLAVGPLSDRISKRRLLYAGMGLQGMALLCWPLAQGFGQFAALMAILGLGTAMVYPTFLAAIAQHAPVSQRAESLGIFRLWRDLGYVAGALLSGVGVVWLGLSGAVVAVGGLTLASGAVVYWRMPRG